MRVARLHLHEPVLAQQAVSFTRRLEDLLHTQRDLLGLLVLRVLGISALSSATRRGLVVTDVQVDETVTTPRWRFGRHLRSAPTFSRTTRTAGRASRGASASTPARW